MSRDDKIIEILTVTAELMGHQISAAALNVMIDDLCDYSVEEIATAATKLRKKAGRFSLPALIENIPGGFVGGNEAWSTFPKSEQETGVVTQQALSAWAAACALYESGDTIAARAAFIDAYNRNVNESNGRPEYTVSLGQDLSQRAGAIHKAIDQGLLPLESAGKYLSSSNLINLETDSVDYRAIEEKFETSYFLPDPQRKKNEEQVAKLKAMLNVKTMPKLTTTRKKP